MIFRMVPWKKYASQSLGELFSTCLLIFIGNLSVAQKKFTPVASRSDAGVHISYGIAVYVALVIGVPVSGRQKRKAGHTTNQIDQKNR